MHLRDYIIAIENGGLTVELDSSDGVEIRIDGAELGSLATAARLEFVVQLDYGEKLTADYTALQNLARTFDFGENRRELEPLAIAALKAALGERALYVGAEPSELKAAVESARESLDRVASERDTLSLENMELREKVRRLTSRLEQADVNNRGCG